MTLKQQLLDYAKKSTLLCIERNQIIAEMRAYKEEMELLDLLAKSSMSARDEEGMYLITERVGEIYEISEDRKNRMREIKKEFEDLEIEVQDMLNETKKSVGEQNVEMLNNLFKSFNPN